MSRISAPLRRHLASIRALLVFTVICGIAFPLVVTGIAQAVLNKQANGSLIKDASGKVVGSSLLCQQYVDAKGNALPQYFQTRPSAATDPSNSSDPGCNYKWSGGSNLGTQSSALKTTIEGRITSYEQAFSVTRAQVPQDAVTASASGMDPDISPANAEIQAPFVAKARGVDVSVVEGLVKKNTVNRALEILGEKVVNAVTLNLDLDNTAPLKK
jgi:K+-transporting ATPase ATPase C chain